MYVPHCHASYDQIQLYHIELLSRPRAQRLLPPSPGKCSQRMGTTTHPSRSAPKPRIDPMASSTNSYFPETLFLSFSVRVDSNPASCRIHRLILLGIDPFQILISLSLSIFHSHLILVINIVSRVDLPVVFFWFIGSFGKKSPYRGNIESTVCIRPISGGVVVAHNIFPDQQDVIVLSSVVANISVFLFFLYFEAKCF